MITFCLLVGLGILTNTEPTNYVCTDLPDYSSYTIYMTSYYPPFGDHNCQEPCNLTAIGYEVEEWYGRGAGCPLPLLQYGTTVVIKGRPFQCIDTGGAVMVVEDSNAIRIDLLRNLGYNDNYLIENPDYWVHDPNVTDFKFIPTPHWESSTRKYFGE